MESGKDKVTSSHTARSSPLTPMGRAEVVRKLGKLEAKRKELKETAENLGGQIQVLSLKEKYLSDLYLFARDIVGFKDLDPKLHRQLCNFVTGVHPQKLLLIPRGHFKTSLVSIAYPLWCLCRDQRERICLASVTSDLAKDNLREIVYRAKLERFQRLFGDTVGAPEDWDECRIAMGVCRIKREGSVSGPSLYAMGVDSSETGRHFSLMVLDDIVNEDKTSSPLILEDVWDWFGRQQSVIDPGGRMIVVGTRWHWDDPYSRIQKLDDWEKMIRQDIEKGVPIFPSRFTLEKLAQIRALQGDFRYSCFYKNDPAPEGVNPFDVNRFRWISYERKEDARTYVLIDPASGRETWSCYSGIIIGDALPQKKFVVTEAILEKLHPDALVDLVFDLIHRVKPSRIIIEAEAYQKSLYYWIKREYHRRKLYVPIDQVRSPRNVSKYSRLLSLQPYLHSGSILFDENMPGREHIKEEFSRYPKGPHDDLVAALSFVPPGVTYPAQHGGGPPKKTLDRRHRTLHDMIHRRRRDGRLARVRIKGR